MATLPCFYGEYSGQPRKENSQFQDHSIQCRGLGHNHKERQMVWWKTSPRRPLHRNQPRHTVHDLQPLGPYYPTVLDIECPGCQLCSGLHITWNHKCEVITGQGRGRRECTRTIAKCANCRRLHYATSTICLAGKHAIALARSRRNEWRTLEIERQCE